MRKVVLFLLSGLLTITCTYAQTVLRFGADFTGNPTSYTFTSTDITYPNASGGSFSTSSSNLCSGALRRTQLSTIVLKLVSSGASAISIPGQSSGSSLRTLTLLETASTINGTYTTVPAASYTTSSTINSSSSCGVLDITGLNIPSGTFVRFTFSGNISVSGFDITPVATGTPSTQASNIVFSNISQTGMTIGWTRGNGSNVAVFVKDGAGAITNPTNGSTYTANTVFASGTQLGSSGYYCVYNGNSTSVDVSGLTASHTYYVQAFEFNGAGATTNYLTTTATNNPNSQATLAPGSNYRSAASGNWNSIATWEVYNGTAWVAASSSPSSSDGTITIGNGHVVTVTANVSVDELAVNGGGEIDINNGITFTVANGSGTDITLNGTVKNTGTFTLGANATMTVAATGIYEDAQAATTGTVSLPTATWNAGSTCKVSGIVGVFTTTPQDFTTLQGVNQTFSNFTIDVPNLIGKLVLTRNAANLFVVSGTLTINSTGSSTYGVQLTSSGNQEAVTVGSFIQNGGVVSILHNSSNATAKSLTVAGGFTLTGTSIFNISAYTTGSGVSNLNVGGAVSVAPTALLQRNTSLGTGGTTNMTFNGSSAQSVTMVTAGTINYTINNAAGISLGSDITANGTLTFTAGNIITGSSKVIIAVTGSMPNAGIGGWVAGNLQKNVATGAAVTKTFETGDASGYRPVSVTFANVNTTGDLTATVSQSAGDHASIAGSGVDANKTVNRYWTLTNSGVVFDQYDVTFSFLAGDVDASANTAAFVIKKYNGSAWSSTTAGTRTVTTTQATGVSSFSDFIIGEVLAGAAPTVSTQPNSGSVCVGSNTSFTSASLSSPAPTIQWERSINGTTWVSIDGTLDGGIYSNFTTGTLNITGTTIGINGYQYRAVFTNVNGTVNSNAATLTVDPASVGGTASGDQTICSGTAPANLSLTNNTGSVVKWQKASDAVFTTPIDIASASTTLTGATIGNLSATTYFRVVVKSGSCADANSSVVTVTVNPIPSVTSSNTVSVCSGVAMNIPLTASVASNFSWTIGTVTGGITGATGASGSTITQTLTNPGNSTAGTVQYIVTPTSTATPACPGSPYAITVTVNPKPAVTSSNTLTICSNTSTNIALTASAAGSFSWTLGTNTGGITGGSAGSGNTIAQTLINPGNSTAGSLEYLVTTTSTTGSCVSDAYAITATVNPTPAVTTSNTATICSGDITNISLTASTASSFTWTVGTITGGITGGTAGSGNIIAQVLTNPSTVTSGTIQYIVTATSTATPACPASPYTITVTVNPGSGGLAGIAGSASVCGSHDAAISLNYYNSCNPIANVTPTGGNPVTGVVNACVKIDAAVNVSMPYVQRTYTVTAAATSTANVTLYFLQSEFDAFNAANGSFGDLPANSSDATGKANLRISVFPTASHTPGGLGEGLYDPADANIVFNSAASRWEVTMPITFTANNSFFVHTNHWPLPISLIDFKGEQAGTANKLIWSTATENNSRGFEVERSADGQHFSSIGIVISKAENGNSISVLNYQLIDNIPFAGNSYYRLKQIDKDGKFAYSKVIMLGRKIDAISLATIYPNPSVKELNVVVNSPKTAKITFIITDLSGKVMLQRSSAVAAGENQQIINVQQLAAGTYIIKAICDDGCESAVQRFVKQ